MPHPPTPGEFSGLSARTIARSLTTERDAGLAQTALINALIEKAVPALLAAREALDRFHAMMRSKEKAWLDPWITMAAKTKLAAFAAGVEAKNHAYNERNKPRRGGGNILIRYFLDLAGEYRSMQPCFALQHMPVFTCRFLRGLSVIIRAFDIPGPLEIIPQKLGDNRGYFTELFREDRFEELAGIVSFVQENQSLSSKLGTIRGLHFQSAPMAQGKLVRCVAGAIFDVAVDIRQGSETFGQWVGVELTPDACNQLWVPPGFAHGFCTLKPDTIVCYKVTSYYSAECDKGARWDDPAIGIAWPDVADASTLSGKDKIQPLLADLPTYFQMGTDR